MRTNILIRFSVIFCALFLISCSASTEMVSKDALSFSLRDISNKRLDMADYLGKKIILLNFWATWCPACNEEIPALKKFYSEYNKKIAIFSIDVGETSQKVSGFAEKKAINYPVLLDEKNTVANLYSVRGIPTAIVIDLSKKIVYYGYDLGEAKNAVDKLLK